MEEIDQKSQISDQEQLEQLEQLENSEPNIDQNNMDQEPQQRQSLLSIPNPISKEQSNNHSRNESNREVSQDKHKTTQNTPQHSIQISPRIQTLDQTIQNMNETQINNIQQVSSERPEYTAPNPMLQSQIEEDPQFMQVQTELTEQKSRTITPTYEQDPKPKSLVDDQISKHKIILQSPRQKQIANAYQIKQIESEVERNILVQKFKQITEEQLNKNLQEIYLFYVKQGMLKGKLNTFDDLYYQANNMTLQKLMFFCKDFRLIDLEITPALIKQLGGQQQKRKIHKLYKHNQNLIVNKFLLVEMFKKCCKSQQELQFPEFNNFLNKLGEIIFPDENSIQLLYEYLEVKEPSKYRKKMILVGNAFNSREPTQKLTQEILINRRVILPPRPRAISVRQDDSLPQIIINPQKKEISNYKKTTKDLMKWDDLNQVPADFDPKDLLLEQDLSDKEDQIYLNEYQMDKKNQSKQSIEPVKETLKPILHLKTEGKQSVSPNSKRYSDVHGKPQEMKKLDNKLTEKQKLIYETFMRNQEQRENKYIKKK
ncbi:hypothetical protein pb186bvf_012049 [Paramecium bursaria]